MEQRWKRKNPRRSVTLTAGKEGRVSSRGYSKAVLKICPTTKGDRMRTVLPSTLLFVALICSSKRVRSMPRSALWTQGALVGPRFDRGIEKFPQARFVRITHWRLPVWLDPFGMLGP
jgi:hypothetical protein